MAWDCGLWKHTNIHKYKYIYIYILYTHTFIPYTVHIHMYIYMCAWNRRHQHIQWTFKQLADPSTVWKLISLMAEVIATGIWEHQHDLLGVKNVRRFHRWPRRNAGDVILPCRGQGRLRPQKIRQRNSMDFCAEVCFWTHPSFKHLFLSKSRICYWIS